MNIAIGTRMVGHEEPVFIIAEIGVNHDGSVERAMQLVDIAADCGADAVKLQLFRADRLMHPSAGFAEYQRSRVSARDPIAMLRQYELRDEEIAAVADRARARGLQTIATPFSIADVELIKTLQLPAIKIASPDVVNLPLIRQALRCQKPLLISTGAATMHEVRRCVHWCGDAPIALLHCVSSYPVDSINAQLSWIRDLAGNVTAPIGYSDHTTSEIGGALAVAAGACFVEKHLTYDTEAAGPDHSASADPAAFSRYIAAIREAQQLMGSGSKRVLPIENDVRTVSRQSLVLRRNISAGEPITIDSLVTQRPGTGIPVADADCVAGSPAARDLTAGTMLQWDMLVKADANAA